MDETFNDRIDILRKKSRFLLAQVDKNSKKVKKEFQKLYSQNLTLRDDYQNCVNKCFHSKRNITSWYLRNDSSGVGAALYTDCFCNNSNNTLRSMPNISTPKKLLISSKKHCEERQCCPKNIVRKPVKECYCYPEIKKIQLRSTRTQHKRESPCRHCKSHNDFKPAVIIEDTKRSNLSSPISCETLRRVQKIDYAPRSQFLRNVQSKVSLLQTAGDCPEPCFRSACYHDLMGRKSSYNIDSIHHATVDKESKSNYDLTKSRSSSKLYKSLESSEEEQTSGSESIDKSDEDIQMPSKRQLKPKLITKRTLTSKKSVPDIKKTKSNSKISIKSKKVLQPHYREHSYVHDNKVENPSRTILNKDAVNLKDYQQGVYLNSKLEKGDGTHVTDKEVKELRTFREQNYFDTHGSSHTLISSRSSGSLEQYVLNDRLFPESTRRIHKKDLVVTMPACATLQRKRMHYFPRYIVRQEKGNSNINHKKKRCQSCPLTGHAIDLGVTKTRSPLNSLALKYQKRLP
ncbi:uncharacterized protein LOC143188987 [Calliopsis andreniformis]|uniref:uncharacterized protein LOC143188987 n=1 Tax=Calliopsis andreniformis TaxID=337506 RepID=UPI003FCC9ED2